MFHMTMTNNAYLAKMMTRQAEMLREDGMVDEAGELLERALSLHDAARFSEQESGLIH